MTHPDFSRNGFVASASEALRALLIKLAKPRTLTVGQVLFSQGDAGETLFAVGNGKLEISLLSPEGTKLILAIMHEGDILGEIALFAPGPRTATVTALLPTTVWGIKNTDVLAALRFNPDLQLDMIELAGQRLRWMGQQYSEQIFVGVPTRLARRILHLIGPYDTELRMSQHDLASFVGVTRETVSKTLSVWKKTKVISLGRGSIKIINRAVLTEIAENEVIR